MAPWESTPSTSIHEHPARCTGRDRSWHHGGAPNPRAYTSILCSAHGSMGEHPIHEHPRASCALHKQRSLMGPWESIPSTSSHEHPAPTSIHEHPGHCTGRDRSWAHGRAPYPQAFTSILCAAIVGKGSWPHGRAPYPRASTSILRAAQAGTAHGIMGEHPIHEHTRASCALHMGPWDSTPSTSIHGHPVRCTGRDRSWVLGRAYPPRAATSALRAAQVGIAPGSMGEHTTHEDPRASCALLMGPWESTPSTSIHEHHVRCTGRSRSWVHGGAPHPRASTSILGAATVGNAHGPMREHPIHENPRAACALHRQGSLRVSWESTPCRSNREHPAHCAGKDRSWAHVRAPHPRAYASTLRAAQVGIAHGYTGEHPVTSIHEHPVRFTGRSRTWAHSRAPNPHAYTSIMCAAQVGIAHGPWESIPSTSIHAQHPIHEHPRAPWVPQQVEIPKSLMDPCEGTPSTSIHEHHVR